MKDISHLPDGYYVISSPKEPRKCLVYLYDHPDFNGVRHLSWMHQDGSALMPVTDLTEESILTPVKLVPSTTPTTTTDLSEEPWLSLSNHG